MTIMPGQFVPGSPAMIVRYAVGPVARIVVGVDGSAGSAAALRWAAAEACRRQAVRSRRWRSCLPTTPNPVLSKATWPFSNP
jgi:nucleotide-binding universal stress UspA family protein